MTGSDLEAVRAELAELEGRAGIAEKVAEAHRGSLFLDPNATPTEHFREREDYARGKVRDLYFAVDNLPLRKELITKSRECHRARSARFAKGVAEAREELRKAEKAARSPAPWLQAAFMGAASVAVGAGYWKLYGAIGGAVVGFFLGHYNLTHERENRAEIVRIRQRELDSVRIPRDREHRFHGMVNTDSTAT